MLPPSAISLDFNTHKSLATLAEVQCTNDVYANTRDTMSSQRGIYVSLQIKKVEFNINIVKNYIEDIMHNSIIFYVRLSFHVSSNNMRFMGHIWYAQDVSLAARNTLSH